MRALSCVLLAVLLLAGCSPRRIPGTDIADTADTRAIVAAIEAYRRAAERRDVEAVLALVSQKYFDEAGTPDPSDDIDFQGLRKQLAEDYSKITSLRMEIGVKRVDVDDAKASAYIFFEEHYKIRTPAGEVAKQAADSGRMNLAREGGTWRFTSGL